MAGCDYFSSSIPRLPSSLRNHNVNELTNAHGRQITSTFSDRIVLINVVN